MVNIPRNIARALDKPKGDYLFEQSVPRTEGRFLLVTLFNSNLIEGGYYIYFVNHLALDRLYNISTISGNRYRLPRIIYVQSPVVIVETYPLLGFRTKSTGAPASKLLGRMYPFARRLVSILRSINSSSYNIPYIGP